MATFEPIGSLAAMLGAGLGKGMGQELDTALTSSRRKGELQQLFRPEARNVAELIASLPEKDVARFLGGFDIDKLLAQPQQEPVEGVKNLGVATGGEEGPSANKISAKEQLLENQPPRQQKPPLDLFGKKLEGIALREQQQINQANAPFLTNFSKQVKIEKELNHDVKKALQILEHGKKHPEEATAHGIMGAFTPGFAQSTQTQKLSAIYSSIASKLLAGTGVLSAAKIAFAERIKAALFQSREAQEDLLKQFEATTNETLMRDKIKDALIKENRNRQPNNIEGAINERYALLEKLPPNVPNGKKFTDEDEPGSLYMMKNGIPYRLR